MNRLTDYGMTGDRQSVVYDALGNITHKSDVGDYSYGSQCSSSRNAGPHAVCATSDGVDYTYDNNGNLTSDSSGTGSHGESVGGRTIIYSTFDKPLSIVKGSHTTTFKYGPDRARYERLDVNTSSNTTKRTLYLGSVEKIIETKASGTTYTLKRYLPGGMIETKAYAVDPHSLATIGERAHYLLTDADKSNTRFILKDHLGSTNVILDEDLSIDAQYLSFDPWGKRRNGVTWNAENIDVLLDSFSWLNDTTTRGFTEHEMLEEVGLVHMNGRIYDSRIARFVQADPFIDGAADSQGYNRYGYVRNNPLNATDPTGHFLVSLAIGAALGAAFGAAGKEFDLPWLSAVGSIISCGSGIGCAAGFAFGSTLGSGGSLTDAFKGAIFSAVSATAFSAIGTTFSGTGGGFLQAGCLGHIAAHAMVGGVMSVLQGGKFGHGFVSAGLTKAANINRIMSNNAGATADTIRTFVAGIVGGTTSKVTGGKFSNGAITAAFGQAFNGNKAIDDKVAAQKGQKLKPHDPKSGSYQVDVPEEVTNAVSIALGTDVSGIRVIANSKWANFLNWISGFRGYRVDATTLKNTIYLPSHVSPQEFLVNHELILHEYNHVVNQWNNGRMNVFNYLLSPQKWEAESYSFASENRYLLDHMLTYKGPRQW